MCASVSCSGCRPDWGGNGGGVTPLPIPNREVKPSSADGTARETGWESRSPPQYCLKPRCLAPGLFFRPGEPGRPGGPGGPCRSGPDGARDVGLAGFGHRARSSRTAWFSGAVESGRRGSLAHPQPACAHGDVRGRIACACPARVLLQRGGAIRGRSSAGGDAALHGRGCRAPPGGPSADSRSRLIQAERAGRHRGRGPTVADDVAEGEVRRCGSRDGCS